MSWISAARERLRGLFFRTREEAETEEELHFHIEMEAARLTRETGLDALEARRRALVAFGGVDRYKEEVRDARGLAWVSGLSLDLKLGLRNLVKYPGLAIVGGLGMAVATAIGAAAFAIINSYFYPTLTLHEGDRVVSVLKYEARFRRQDSRLLHDLIGWRHDLRTLVDVGAYRSGRRNLIAPSGEAVPITVAEMTASGFRVARVPPLLGRTLLDGDEASGAPPVVVIGYDVWQTRFERDPAIVGRTVRLGATLHSIVGVMPEGFAFPISHSWWVPLHVPPAERVKPGSGPDLDVFARLAPGATRDAAEAELALVARRERLTAAVGDTASAASFRFLVDPYAHIFTREEAADGGEWHFALGQALLSLLLVVVCLNVAVLVYARTVARTTEIAVRTALGATRRRIVWQLFAEALVLSGLAALVGLTMVAIGLHFLDQAFVAGSDTGRQPFWIDTGLSLGTVLYTLALAVLGAAIVGVLPGLRATGAQLRVAMGSPGGGTQARLGGTWTFLIVAQVAIAVAALPPAMLQGAEFVRHANQEVGFPAGDYLTALFSIDRGDETDAAADGAHADSALATVPALVARLEEEPGVAGVTVATTIPGGGWTYRVELDSMRTSARSYSTTVDQRYFDVFGVRVLAGRTFASTDAARSADRPVIVNRSFVDEVLGGGAAVGRRLRYPGGGDEARPWLEIIGVVEDFPSRVKDPGETGARIYHLVQPTELRDGRLLVRLRGQTPDAFASTLRRVALSVDPTLQLRDVGSLAAIYADEGRLSGLFAVAVALITASVLLLSAAGIHALMSFTVNQRRREIGVRAALGADARQILTSVLARATRQLASGVSIGLAMAFLLDRLTDGEMLGGKGPMLVPTVAVCMLVVGLLAAAGPARRGLRVSPTEALRADA